MGFRHCWKRSQIWALFFINTHKKHLLSTSGVVGTMLIARHCRIIPCSEVGGVGSTLQMRKLSLHLGKQFAGGHTGGTSLSLNPVAFPSLWPGHHTLPPAALLPPAWKSQSTTHTLHPRFSLHTHAHTVMACSSKWEARSSWHIWRTWLWPLHLPSGLGRPSAEDRFAGSLNCC